MCCAALFSIDISGAEGTRLRMWRHVQLKTNAFLVPFVQLVHSDRSLRELVVYIIWVCSVADKYHPSNFRVTIFQIHPPFTILYFHFPNYMFAITRHHTYAMSDLIPGWFRTLRAICAVGRLYGMKHLENKGGSFCSRTILEGECVFERDNSICSVVTSIGVLSHSVVFYFVHVHVV